MSGCKQIPGLTRAHFEHRRGSEQEASTYCKKDGDFWEYGTCTPGERSRTDAIKFQQLLKSGLSDLELMEVDFNAFNRFSKTVDRYRSLTPIKRAEDLAVHLFVGDPGTGKTRLAYELMPTLYAFPIGPTLWSDGYCGQTDVLIDDFAGQMRLVDLLRFIDRYPIQIPRKGAFNWWCPTRIIITTMAHPSTWYKWDDRKTQQMALRRRIHFVWDFNDKTHGPTLDQPKLYNGSTEIENYWPIV